MNSTIFGELTSFNILYYLILIVFAGLLLGNRATVYTALINFLTIGTIFALEPIEVLSVTRLSTTAFGIWLSVGMQITLITLFMLLANRANKKSLDEASRGPTERLDKNGERASSERPYRLMVENISEPIFLLDRDMGFKYISPAGERDMGIISKEHLGKSLIEFVHPEDQEQVAAMFYELVGQPGVVARTECRILGKSFQWLWYGVVAVNKLSDPDLMAIVANFNEISSRVEAEDRSRRQGLRNRKLAELSKLLAESSQDYEAVLWTIARQVAEILNCGCSVVLISNDNQWLDYVASYNADKEVEEVWQRIRENERQKINEGIMGQVVGEGKPVLIPEVDPDAFLAATKPEFREYLKDVVYQTILVVPMRAHGQVLGALGLSRQAPGPAFTVLDQDFAQDLGDRCALAIINARLFSDLQGELGERKQAQAALKRSQETLAEAQRIGNMGSYVFDIQTKKMSWSDQLYRISGLEPGDTPVDEDFASSFVHPQDWDAVRQNTKSALENGFSAVEHRIITKSGDLRYMYTSTHAFYNENGVAVGLMGTVQDITNRKKVEIDLHQRDAILEAVALAAQNFMHSADWDKNVWALLKILGEKNNASRAYIYRNEFERRESPVTALHYQWINPERVSDLQVTIPQVMYLNEEALDGWSRTMQAGKPYYGNIHRMTEREKRLLLIGDAKTFIHVPVFSGDDWQGFIGFDDPTSERSWSTAEVDALTVAAGLIGAAIQSQRAELARRESERLVRILGDNLPGGAIYQLITYPNGDRKYTYISEGVESLLGISAVQVLEDAENLYKRVHPYDRDMYLKLEDDCIRNMEVFDAKVHVDGHGMNVRWCHFRAAPRQGEGNEITWNGVIQDITPQKEAEEAIHALNVELEARRTGTHHRTGRDQPGVDRFLIFRIA